MQLIGRFVFQGKDNNPPVSFSLIYQEQQFARYLDFPNNCALKYTSVLMLSTFNGLTDVSEEVHSMSTHKLIYYLTQRVNSVFIFDIPDRSCCWIDFNFHFDGRFSSGLLPVRSGS